MDNDAAILLVIADLRRAAAMLESANGALREQVAALQAENAELRGALAPRQTEGTMSDPDPAQHGEARVMNC